MVDATAAVTVEEGKRKSDVSAESATGIGAAVRRREDARFITGRGQYTDDLNRYGQTFAVFLRSPHARARIISIDLEEAQRVPGLVAIYTGRDMAADGIGDLPCGWMVHSKDGSPMKQPAHPPLAVDSLNYAGEPYGIVIAETLAAARSAAELVIPEFEELDRKSVV